MLIVSMDVSDYYRYSRLMLVPLVVFSVGMVLMWPRILSIFRDPLPLFAKIVFPPAMAFLTYLLWRELLRHLNESVRIEGDKVIYTDWLRGRHVIEPHQLREIWHRRAPLVMGGGLTEVQHARGIFSFSDLIISNDKLRQRLEAMCPRVAPHDIL